MKNNILSDQGALLSQSRGRLDDLEKKRLSPYAAMSKDAVRNEKEDIIDIGHRQNYALDADRILHSMAYTRYIDKTQVFYLIRNDHITHRVLHVQLLSKIARTVGRLLSLNEDLIEAIALGHDIGHAPFGHDGEKILDRLCIKHGIGHFSHAVQSVVSLQILEKHAKGLNLSLQTLDGILCHDGEIHDHVLVPDRDKTFVNIEEAIIEKTRDNKVNFYPMTLEACVVRLCDTVSYIGRDIEDAIKLNIIKREDIPASVSDVLGSSNGTIVYRLVEDMVANSLGKDYVGYSTKTGEALKALKGFNYKYIYENKEIKKELPKIELMYEMLFEYYLDEMLDKNKDSMIQKHYLKNKDPCYWEKSVPAIIVRDYIANMTDNFFLEQCKRLFLPSTKSYQTV